MSPAVKNSSQEPSTPTNEGQVDKEPPARKMTLIKKVSGKDIMNEGQEEVVFSSPDISQSSRQGPREPILQSRKGLTFGVSSSGPTLIVKEQAN